MQALFDIILPVFVVIGFGYTVTWRGLFSESAVDGVVKFTQNFAIPCLLFRAMSEIDIGDTLNARLLLTYYTGAFTTFFVAYSCARKIFDRNSADAIAIAFCCFFSNTILLGLPITERAYGTDALSGNFAIIAFHVPLLYLLGVTSMEFVQNRSSRLDQKLRRVLMSMFRNPFVIGIALGFCVNIANVPLPAFIVSGVDLLAEAALPAALFGLGGILFQYRPEGDSKAIIMVCAISLVFQPAITFGVGLAMALDQNAMRSAVLTASMAPGVNTFIFANMYGAARRVAAASVLLATAGSIISIWIWLEILSG